jgi:hypothetical protein
VETYVAMDFKGLNETDMSDLSIFIYNSMDIVMLENLFNNLRRIALRNNGIDCNVQIKNESISDNTLTPNRNDRFIDYSNSVVQK